MNCTNCGKPVSITGDQCIELCDDCFGDDFAKFIGHMHNKYMGQQVYGLPWVCPNCGAIYGPNQSECYRCNPPRKYEITCKASDQ